MRLQKVIADAGLASRREAERWIAEGKVRVNGSVVRQAGVLADPEQDRIRVNGKLIPPSRDKTYMVLNKPPGCLTTMVKDPRGRRTVMDFLKKVPARVFPVGRLDYHTQGLLLFTNDGNLSRKLLAPKSRVERTYQVKVRGIPEEKALNKLRKGIRLDYQPTAPIQTQVLRITGKNCVLTMKLVEGKNRHIKRVCEKIGHPVIKLKRTHFGKINLTGLPLGAYRFLTPREMRSLFDAVRKNDR
ncbi:MAG: pseudouridine synthase [Nitrospinaceae bacterium]